MRLRNLLGIALGFRLLVGCHRAVQPRPPIARVCAANRIGQVIIEGAPRSTVVLESTLDDRPRTERIAKIAAEGLRARGFLTAELAISREAGCGTDLVAVITLGPKFRIARISFDTDDELPAATRLALIEDALGTP